MHAPSEVKVEMDMAAPDAQRVLGKKFDVEITHPGVIFGEGPVWDTRTRHLYYTDICGNTIWKWKPGGKPEAIMNPSNMANGMQTDAQGRLVVCGWGGRTIFRLNTDGSNVTTLMTEWEGKKLNSPNDIAIRSDGSITTSSRSTAFRPTAKSVRSSPPTLSIPTGFASRPTRKSST